MKNYNLTLLAIGICSLITSGCKKFMEIPFPTDKFAIGSAYLNDRSAGAVLTGIISTAAINPIYNGTIDLVYDNIGYRTSLYSDDLMLLQAPSLNSLAATSALYYTDALTSSNSLHWTSLYKQIYNCNLTIENLNTYQNNLSKYNQWMGEALFFRAFSYFDLVNLYGDVPLPLTSNYDTNTKLVRVPSAQVYAQMIEDLKQAESLLGTVYLDGLSASTVNRVRPNQYAAAALLARVYLYTGDYAKAEAESSKVISNTALYELTPPTSAFLANGKETIWALAPQTPNFTRGYYLYNKNAPTVSANQVALAGILQSCMTESLVSSFEPTDLRLANWVTLRTTTDAPVNGKFYFPNKYKSNANGVEFDIILRIAEQYLIRAEARLKQNKSDDAKLDINAIRARAGLGNTPATTPADLMAAIMKERRTELFTEYGQRFYDLKRTGAIDAVMNAAAPLKGGTWASWKQIWPIPLDDTQLNTGLTQAPFYQ